MPLRFAGGEQESFTGKEKCFGRPALQGPSAGADVAQVRARLMLKLVTLFVLLVCTVLGARSCNPSSPASPLNPGNVARNGLNGVCADQQAVDNAGGGSSTGVVAVPQSVQQELGALAGTSVSCTTTTTPADAQP